MSGIEAWWRARSAERGSASIWVLTLASLVLFVGAVTMTMSAIGVGRARATAAADVAALAGAQHLSDRSACRWAQEAARRNSAELSVCQPATMDVTVSVTMPVRLPFWPLRLPVSLRATARAGPAGHSIAEPPADQATDVAAQVPR